MSVSECDALTDGGRSSRHRRLLHRWSRLTQQWRPWQASLNRCTRQTENSLIFINAFIYHVSSSSSFYCCLLLSPCPTYVRVSWRNPSLCWLARLLSFKRPLCQLTDVSVCVTATDAIHVGQLMLNISETQLFRGSCAIETLLKKCLWRVNWWRRRSRHMTPWRQTCVVTIFKVVAFLNYRIRINYPCGRLSPQYRRTLLKIS